MDILYPFVYQTIGAEIDSYSVPHIQNGEISTILITQEFDDKGAEIASALSQNDLTTDDFLSLIDIVFSQI